MHGKLLSYKTYGCAFMDSDMELYSCITYSDKDISDNCISFSESLAADWPLNIPVGQSEREETSKRLLHLQFGYL